MDKSYRQVLQCVKDSVVSKHQEIIGENFPDEQPPGRLTYDLYKDPFTSTSPNPHR